MILFDNVYKKYDNGIIALRNFTYRIRKGDMVFFLGSSGAGKSTVIKLLLREELATAGRVLVEGRDLAKVRGGKIQAYRRNLGVVFQDFRLLPKKNVYQNVAFAMEIFGAPKKEIKKDTDIALSLVGLEDKRHQYPGELSGGEQQRVALARALVNKPKVLIADEPTGNLDPENSVDIMNLLKKINEFGTTVLVATHEQEIARSMGKSVVYLDHGSEIWHGEEELFYHYKDEDEAEEVTEDE